MNASLCTNFSRRGLSGQWFLLISEEAGSQDIHAVESGMVLVASVLSSFPRSCMLNTSIKKIEYEEENLGKTSE